MLLMANIFYLMTIASEGCADGTVEQIFSNVMVGCDGSYTRYNFRSACSGGWLVATASDYFANGGTSVVPNADR